MPRQPRSTVFTHDSRDKNDEATISTSINLHFSCFNLCICITIANIGIIINNSSDNRPPFIREAYGKRGAWEPSHHHKPSSTLISLRTISNS